MTNPALGIEAALLHELRDIDLLIQRRGLDPRDPKSTFAYEYGQLAEKLPVLHAELTAGRAIDVAYAIVRGNLNRLWEKVEALEAA